jgi:hypothetical protein
MQDLPRRRFRVLSRTRVVLTVDGNCSFFRPRIPPTRPPDQQTADSRTTYPYESGAPLAALFSGGLWLASLQPDPGTPANVSAKRRASRQAGCGGNRSIKPNARLLLPNPLLAKLRSIFEPPVVFASGALLAPSANQMTPNCTPGACAGQYMTPDFRDCPPACIGSYPWFYNDPTIAGPCDGYNFSGAWRCFWGCERCEEISCNPC